MQVPTFHWLRTVNEGLDVGQFLKQLAMSNAEHQKYDLILKIHSKTDDVWRQHSLSALCGSAEQVQALYRAFDDHPELGLVAPQGTLFQAASPPKAVWQHLMERYFSSEPSLARAFDNSTVERMRAVDRLLFPNSTPFDHPLILAGTQFWMRGSALRMGEWAKVLDLCTDRVRRPWLCFTAEYQANGKLEHVIERLFATRAYADGWALADVMPAPRPVAIYFPQFHSIPENDRFWGANFTEWTLLAPSTNPRLRKPLPIAQGGLGYYNALDRDIRTRQATLARSAGVHGFCFYHYWFSGVGKVMHRVPEARLADGEPDLPFMLSWANEPWTRRWDGFQRAGSPAHETMIAQTYGNSSDWAEHFDYLQQFWSHPKYIRIGGRPVFSIYRTGHMPQSTLAAMLSLWEARAKSRGIEPPLVIATIGNFFDKEESNPTLANPNPGTGPYVEGALHFWPMVMYSCGFFPDRNARGDELLASNANLNIGTDLQFWGAHVGFDRVVRYPDAKSFTVSPTQVQLGLVQSFAAMRDYQRPNPNLLFINAWNEWNEQAVLEPDTTHGDGMLRAVQQALRQVPVRTVFSHARDTCQ